MLEDADSSRRIAAVKALRDAKHEARWATPNLIRALRADEYWAVRFWAAEALGEIGNGEPAVIDALTGALQDERVVYSAASALGKLGPSSASAVPALAELLDKDNDLGSVVIPALAKIGPAAKPAVPALIRYLKRYPNNDYVMWPLARIGPGAIEAVPALIEALRDPLAPDRRRAGAALALGKIGHGAKAAIPDLRTAAAEGVENAGKALKEIGSDEEAVTPGTASDH